MERSLLKQIAASVRNVLFSYFGYSSAKALGFEAFFRSAAAHFMYAAKLLPDTDTSLLTELMPDLFPYIGMHSRVHDASAQISKILADIPDNEWQNNVQLVGQLYQYCNSVEKDSIFDGLKKNSKVSSDTLPAATQIFTPDWIVRYMTDNTLGSVLGARCGFDTSSLEYYVPRNTPKSSAAPEDITFLDPCMGSGNILVYTFDLFMKLYLSRGYDALSASKLILTRNIFGIDIDSRARRMAHFAILMKAAQYAPEIIRSGTVPQVYDMEDLQSCGEQFRESALFGSLIRPVTPPEDSRSKAAAVYDLLTRKYSAVVTNPPYMSSSSMNESLLSFIKQNYYDSRFDLFSAFIVRCCELADPDGYLGFLTPYVWMFIHSYEKLRRMLFDEKTLETLIQFEYSAFEEATVPVCAFTIHNRKTDEYGSYFRLTEFRGGLKIQREKLLAAISDRSCGYVYEACSEHFSRIPDAPAAYWLSSRVTELFEKYPPLGSISAPRKGNSTSDNDRFLRLWFEVDKHKMNLGCHHIDRAETLTKRWFPYNKGGGYRKWYGFNDYLIDWYDDAAEMRRIPTAVIANYQYFTKAGLTWSTLTSGKFSIRSFGEGYIFDNGGCCIFELGNKKNYICALLNSKVFAYIFGQLNPTLNFQSGEVAKFPFIYKASPETDRLAEECIAISKSEYDSFETSRDFKRHPLI
ncbi:MAG: N-6 DNA methylase [Ruminococcus sp.]|uniref:Eco57I restriction-modification methylase domain-containing protein n=1 Tax=Ruminococcus sp. TaxID=41978 RepID=UPI0025DD7D76|nr:N-6 DNA methylase [Ruminococcus sp.]MCR5599725.1 N-6 DNA methylase [Ruminococcus sp.]